MTDLFEKRLIIVAGKGGVGRTTLSLVVGKCAAARKKRTLVCLVDAPPRYEGILGNLGRKGQIVEVSPGLHVINLDPVSSREEYGMQVLKSGALHKLVFGNRIVGTFLDAVPGLGEWAMFGKATYHALHTVGGRPEFDVVVFDAPATGHGLDLLSLPTAIASAVPSGRMRDEAMKRISLMRDANRCEVLPLTLPEEMPVSELLELIAGLKKRQLHVSRVAVNMTRGTHLGLAVTALVEGRGSNVEHWLMPTAVAAARERVERDSLLRLASQTGLPLLKLPFIDGGVDGAGLERLVEAFEAEIAS